MVERLPLTAAVLAGGRSSRMGENKALLPFGGETLVARVAGTVGRTCSEVLVVTDRVETMSGTHLPAAVRVVADEMPHAGPLAAIATAMGEASSEWLLTVAVDMPWVSHDLVQLLWDARDGVDAVVPVTAGGPEPLLALYHTRTEGVARELLSRGARRPSDLASRVRTLEMPEDQLRQVDPELLSFADVNTSEELVEARAREAARVGGAAVRVSVKPLVRGGESSLALERQTTIVANGSEIATIQATPDNLDELAAGFLVSEGLISDRSALDGIEVDPRTGLVFLKTSEEVPAGRSLRTRFFTAGCGKGVTFASAEQARDLAPVESDVRIGPDELIRMMGEMDRAVSEQRTTGGVHSCALSRSGLPLLVRVDIGRHNALDKVLGRAWLDDIPTQGSVILTSGRITYEMIVKAARARVPVVVSRRSVSDLAAEIAQDVGITVVGHARGASLTVHTHPERIEGGVDS